MQQAVELQLLMAQKLSSFTQEMIQVLVNGSCLREPKRSPCSNLQSLVGVGLIWIIITGHQAKIKVFLTSKFSCEQVWYLARAEAITRQSVQSGLSKFDP
jgi:hypothetical protein